MGEVASGFTFHEPPEVRYRHYRYNGERTTPNGLEILSVTQALGVLDKSGPLVGWATRETLAGVWTMLRDGYRCPDAAWKIGADMKRRKLGHRFVLNDAAERGTATHKALEDWINERRIPKPDDHPLAWRGYFRALASFLASERPEFMESERVVGSVEHGVAGQRDTVARMRDPKRGLCLVDAKTSKGVYPSSHFRQLAAYDLLGRECGEAGTDSQGILRLGGDGSWELVWLQDMLLPVGFFEAAFLRALAACRDERAIKAAKPKAPA